MHVSLSVHVSDVCAGGVDCAGGVERAGGVDSASGCGCLIFVRVGLSIPVASV